MNKSYLDNRGKLFFPVKNQLQVFKQCTVSVNKQFVFRGIHINNFAKLVTCIQGKILDIIINFDKTADDYLVPKYFKLDPNTELFEILVPKGYGHAFLSLEPESILIYHLEGEFIDSETTHIHYLDPFINIVLPPQVNKNNIIVSEKDDIKHFVKPIDYIVFGTNGFLGSNIVSLLKTETKNFITSDLRLHETDKIRELFLLYKPKYVINCAGITGTPNIFWCDEHKTETIENNITYQLTMAAICKEYGIHLTIFGSGGIFNNDNKVYLETDNGNNFTNYYGECRILLETLVKHYDNVLYLRINYPISSKSSNKNLLTKLLSYKSIDFVELSVTYIDNLFPILFKMIEKSEAGICNFTNPGQINLLDIINIYNETTNSQINPIINPIINNTNHLDLETNKRSFARLYSDKLTKYEPLDIKTAIKDCCKKYII
jgi:dTDP-4-dehydrorhamnose reductase/dTDP-4-dehydrorhamnose 3,5-epimerase-like enzyme